jgi:hypothetical protein
MGENYFEQLGRELLQQKRLMDKLKEENRELRRQLAELREGRGIFLKIGDQRFALLANGETVALENNMDNTDPSIRRAGNSAPLSEKSAAEETLQRSRKEKEPVPVETAKAKEVPFLEEVMLDEFASALTNPVPSTPTTPGPKEKQKNAYEEQKRLRQDLQGSYILE